jgi:hypothetical protein
MDAATKISGDRPWQDTSQARLAQELARIKRRLEQHAAPAQPAQTVDGGGIATSPGANCALDTVVRGFGLSSFERDLLLICAGTELDASLAGLCARVHGDPTRPHPTFGLAMAALEDAHWSAITPGAPLRRWHLIEPQTGAALTTASLRIDEQILHFLIGMTQMDERLTGLVEILAPADAQSLVPSHQLLARQSAMLWAGAGASTVSPVIQLRGDRADCRAVAAAAAGWLGSDIAVLVEDAIPQDPVDQESLIRLWERNTILGSARVLLLEQQEESGADREDGRLHRRAIDRMVERMSGFVMVAGREPLRVGGRASLTLEVRRPTSSEQRDLWRSALAIQNNSGADAIDAVASQFDLSAPVIRAIAAESVAAAQVSHRGIAETAWDLCRVGRRAGLDRLAQRVDSALTWNDLILPEPQRDILREIAAHVRHRDTVYDQWGIAAKSARGLGISALFSGPSGTGKTMAAEVLANALHLDLYRIDLSSVISKYIGETEKNLRRVFEAAEESGAILLFDEADALFGKRSEVKDSHDRYANVEISYLLQRMEAYRGLAILTTNLKSALDPAFLRRLRFVVQFPFPDTQQRTEIWRGIFPAAMPTSGLDPSRLARLNIAGGNIRNIAVGAAFLAADAGEPVRMHHLLAAARQEYAKLERTPTPTEIGGWT